MTEKYFCLMGLSLCEGIFMPRCPECGGEMVYLSRTRHYVCRRCGLSLTFQDIMEMREKAREQREAEMEERKKIRKEYLQWWLSKKK